MLIDNAHEVQNSLLHNLGNNIDGVIQDEPNIVHNPVGVEDDGSIKFDSNLWEVMSELYPGCDFSVLKFVQELYKLKVENGWTENSLTRLLQLLQKVLPSGNKMPSCTYRAKKIVANMSLDYQKIHACPNDCILYWREHESRTTCPTCGLSRFKVVTEWASNSRRKLLVRKNVPAKVLRYFPIMPRLQRLYSMPWVAKEMAWHSTGRMPPGKMRHPVDSPTWKNLDEKYKEFSGESHNVRLALGTDGFNPFGSFSSAHSCWPIMCVPYNLPPGLCMKPEFMMLSLLIEGPKQLGKDIDVYLQPLVAELQELWGKGATTFDAYNKEAFNMRVVLLWTMHDFPAYGNISGCRTKEKFTCPCGGSNTAPLRLHHGRKQVYMSHKQWLHGKDERRKDKSACTFNKKEELHRQPKRLTGIEVEKMVVNLNIRWGKTKEKKQMDAEEDEEKGKKDESSYFFKRSILFDLEY